MTHRLIRDQARPIVGRAQLLAANDRFRTEVLAQLRGEGPRLATEIPDTAEVTRPPDGWFGSNQTVHMLDFLQRQGQVSVAGREGRHRLWDLAERVYPKDMPEYEYDEAERMLNERRLQAAALRPRQPMGRLFMAPEVGKRPSSNSHLRCRPRLQARCVP